VSWHIVPTAEEHIPALHGVLDSVAREKRFLLFLEAPPLEQATAFWKSHIGKGNVAFVALSNDAVVGWCDILPIERQSTRHVGVVGLGVLGSFRGKGIGPALLRAAIEKAFAGGLTRIELDVREDNKAAIALYERLGFQREGLKRNGVRVDGVYYDLISMALLS
jgi:RimJ/RimL family protein N-acetyltransferase